MVFRFLPSNLSWDCSVSAHAVQTILSNSGMVFLSVVNHGSLYQPSMDGH